MAKKGKLHYAALIGDLVASRESQHRDKVQRELTRKVKELNESLGDQVLAADIRVTSGDEIQALFRAPSRIVEAVQQITDRLFGAPLAQAVTFGIGWGQLATGPVPEPRGQAEDVALLDGPCFHRARTSLSRARKRKSWAAFEGFGNEHDVVLDSLFELMGTIRRDWTATQSLYVVTTRELGLQKAVAEMHAVNPSVISNSLRAARYEQILRGEGAARLVLQTFDRA